jgi:flagellar protein FliL
MRAICADAAVRRTKMAKKPKKTGDDADEGGEGGAAPAGKLGFLKNKMVMMGGAGVLALALAGGGYMLFFKKKTETEDSAAMSAKAAQKKTAFVDMKEMVINITSASAQERSSFIKMRISLEIADSKLVPDVQPLLPRIEDTFQVYMRELRPSDLEGSAGMFRLKEELLRRVNVALYPVKVDAVLFKELLVQ